MEALTTKITTRHNLPDWRPLHPLAVEESWREPSTLKLEGKMPDGAEYYENDTYNVTVRRYAEDPVFGSRSGMVQIGISAADGTARHDWRDFQWIKNQVAGPEAEAFELYPAESRLIDPSNYYTLWCFPGCKIKVGKHHRIVLEAAEAEAPQRAFAQTGAPASRDRRGGG